MSGSSVLNIIGSIVSVFIGVIVTQAMARRREHRRARVDFRDLCNHAEALVNQSALKIGSDIHPGLIGDIDPALQIVLRDGSIFQIVRDTRTSIKFYIGRNDNENDASLPNPELSSNDQPDNGRTDTANQAEPIKGDANQLIDPLLRQHVSKSHATCINIIRTKALTAFRATPVMDPVRI